MPGPARLALALIIAILWFKATRLVILSETLNLKAAALKQEALSLSGSGELLPKIAHFRAEIDEMHGLVRETQGTLWPFGLILKNAGWLPGVGRDLSAAPRLIDMADSMLSCAETLDQAYSPLLERALIPGQKQGGVLDLAVEAAQSGGSDLAQARQQLDQAEQARRDIGGTSGLNPKLQAILQTTDRLLDALDKALSGAQTAPALLGVDRPQHVLVLIENADELRATGGFITASAYVVIDHGHLSDPVVIGSNNPQIDNPRIAYETPPPPFVKYMHLQRWYFRDANWWADFPTSATKAAQLYTAGTGRPVDTVVAINQYTVRDLIGAIGPVTLSDGSVVTQDNTIEALQNLWTTDPGAAGTDERKDFIRNLAPVIMAKVLGTRDPGTLVALWKAQQAISARRDLQLYSTAPAIQALSEKLGWDGGLPPGPGDFLYVLDTNVGWNKVDLIMQRSLAYQINLEDLASPTASLQVTYRNPGKGVYIGPACQVGSRNPTKYAQRAQDCYADFIRLYTPGDTTLVESPSFDYPDTYVGFPDPKDAHISQVDGEGDKSVFGGLMVLMPGKRDTLSFTYALRPDAIFTPTADGGLVYDLTIKKQPGRQAFPVTVIIRLPENAPLGQISPEPSARDGNALTFALQADADLHIRIVLRPGTQALQQIGTLRGANEPSSQPPRVLPTLVPLPTIQSN